MSTIPTVGRKVWFFCASLHENINRPDVPFDATVIYVWSPTSVDLLVTDHKGRQRAEFSVTLRGPQPDDVHGSESMFATWMPYQLQAAKREAAA